MQTDINLNHIDQPRVYLVRMVVFLILVAILLALLFPQIHRAFMANPFLNGLIVFALLAGIIYAFRQVWRLFPETNWVNSFRIAEPGHDYDRSPQLLAPMAAMLRDRPTNDALNPASTRSMLDSIASRLDEARDISRYLIGLLVFLGLLGTFWGLLETVSAVGNAIKQLDVASAESATVFEDLKAGLEAPLAGMGISFSSSLFGLAGSLVLGFLDLQSSQAQNRFYNDLEDWLASVTDIAAGDGTAHIPSYLRMDISALEKGIDRVNETLSQNLGKSVVTSSAKATANENTIAMNDLAEAVHSLVLQMREEHKMLQNLLHTQNKQQDDIRRLLKERPSLAAKPGPKS